MRKIQMKSSQMKKYMKLVGNVVSALSILFVLSVFVRTDFRFQAVLDWKKFLFVCIWGIVIKTVTVFLSGSAWAAWLSFFASKRCSKKEALRVYAKANIGKYLPGNVMHYVERNLFAQKLEVPQKRVAASSICEVATLVLTAFLLGMMFAFPMIKNAVANQAVLKVGVFICCFVVGSLVLIAIVLVILKPEVRRFARTLLCCMLLYAAVLIGLGFIFVLLYWYQEGPTAPGQAVAMISCYMAAWAVGFVVPGAPGGIGVRELALVALLKGFMGRDVIVMLGVWHRLITVIGDLAAYVAALLLGRG